MDMPLIAWPGARLRRARGDVELSGALARREVGHRRHREVSDGGSWALLVNRRVTRQGWLESYAQMGERALGASPPWGKEAWPSAFVIPKAQADTQALQASRVDAPARPGRDS
jgi:hypothetical protein